MQVSQRILQSPAFVSLRGWWKNNHTDSSLPAMVLALWCVAISAHFDSRLYWGRDPIYPIAHGAALLGILFGRSVWWQIGVLALQVWSVVAAMPTPDNHWFFSGFVSLLFLTTLVYALIQGRGRMTPELWDRWHERTIPSLRVMIVLLYFFAVLHKLNWDYFDPYKSCGMHFWQRAARARWFFPVMADPPVELRHVIDYGILAMEASIPIFLAFRRTWFLGIVCGASFHLLTGVFMRHFPTIMMCLFFSYIPFDLARRFVAGLDAKIRKLSGDRFGLTVVMFVQALWLTTWSIHIGWIMTVFDVRKTQLGTGYVLLLRVWLTLLVTGFASACVVCLKTRSYRERPRIHMGTRWWLAYLFPVILFVNGFAPFMGLKTSTSIAMWSNLIVAGGKSNHMFIPNRSLEVFPYMYDLVRIRKTNIKSWRKKYIEKRRLVPYMMLQRWVANRAERGRKVQLSFERQGKLYEFEDATKDPELMEPQSWGFRKLVHVKDFRRDLDGRCTW